MSEDLAETRRIAEPSIVHPHVAMLDRDTGFVQVVLRRMRMLDWRCSVNPPVAELTNMRLSALVLDPAALEDDLWSFLERVGRDAPELAVVVCGERAGLKDRVRGLHLGADDWLTKPLHPDELMARIEAILRRNRRAGARLLTEPSVAGELELREDQFQAFIGDESLGLTRREFELLRLLVKTAGKVLTREEIYEQVWGYKMAHGDRSVDVFVRKLRKKIEQRAKPDQIYIHTHFGVGYRFEPEVAT